LAALLLPWRAQQQAQRLEVLLPAPQQRVLLLRVARPPVQQRVPLLD
jgi:hypothetical protein